MVDIPIYRQQVRQAPAADARLGLRATPDAMGASVGEGVAALGRAAGTVAGVVEAERRKANQAVVSARNLDLQTKLVDIRREARDTRGESAAGLREKVLPKFDAAADEIEKGLANDEQREAFKAIRQQQRNDLTEFADVHALREWDSHQSEVFNASGKVFAERVGQVFEDEGQVNAAIYDRIQDVRSYGERMGKGDAWIGTTGADEVSRGVRIAIGKHLEAGNYNGARAAFEKFHQELNDSDHAAVLPAIRAAVVDGESRRLAREIVDAAPAGPSPDTAAAEEAADLATKDAPEEIRAETKRRAVEGVRLKSRAWSETQSAREWQVLGIVTDPKNKLGLDSPDAQQALRSMDPQRATKLRTEIAKASQVEPDPVQSRVALANYEMLITSPDPAVRAKAVEAGPLTGSAGMTVGDQRAAVDLWGKAYRANKGEDGPRREIDTLATKTQAVHDVLRSAGYDVRRSEADGFKSKETAAVVDWIDREAAAAQAARTDSRPWTAADWRTIAGKAVAEQALKGRGTFGGDTTGRTAALAMGQVAQIPANHRAALEERFNAINGRLPTATELLQSWEVYQRANPAPQPTPDERKQRAMDAARATMFFGPM